MKIIVLGCGSIGLRHLRNLLKNPALELAAMDGSADSRREVEAMNAPIFLSASFQEAAAWRPDIAIVATPNHLHKEHTLEFLKMGAHVLCEKPAACSAADAQIMAEAARKAGKILAVGLTERFREAVEFIIGEATSGKLGTLIGGRAMVGTYNTLLCARDPRHRADNFGTIVIDYIHELDILNAIFGKPDKTECFSNRIGDKPLKASPSLVAAILQYRSGAVVSVHFDYVQHPQRRLLEIYGDRKTLAYDFQTDMLTLFDCGKPEPEYRTFNNVRDEQFVREHDDMISAVLNHTPPRNGIAGSIESLYTAERIIGRLK